MKPTSQLESPMTELYRLREQNIEQAAVIEKLKHELKSLIEFEMLNTGARHSGELCCEFQLAVDAISIPTNSKQILADWLDSQLGEPVGYEVITSDNKQMITSFEVHLSGHSCTPLFKKPDVLK